MPPTRSGSDAERLRLRRPAAARPDPVRRAARDPGRLPAALSRHPGRRVPGHQHRPVPVAAAARPTPPQHHLRRRRRPVDLQLARRRGRQHPALRAGFSGRRGDPPRVQLPLDRAHPGRRLGPDRPQSRAPRQDLVDRGRGGRARAHRVLVGRRGGGALRRRGDRGRAARGRALNDIAVLVRAGFRPARSRSASSISGCRTG